MEFVPPRRIFQYPPSSAKERTENAGYDIPNFLFTTRTNTGGVACVYQGHPFPRKGFSYSEAIPAINKAKRFTLALLLPFTQVTKGITAFLESLFFNYNRLVESIFDNCERRPFLKYEYYGEFSKAAWDFTFLFLRTLGISFNTAYRTGHIAASIFEYDDAYRFPLQDVLSESSKEALLANPRKEIRRLLSIFRQRSNNFDTTGTGAGNRVEQVARLFTYLLYLPPIRKAFTFALTEINFKWLQYDQWDAYWALPRMDYESFGRPLKERMNDQAERMFKYAEKMNPGKRIERVDYPDGTINISVHDETRNLDSMAENLPLS